ncbi:MAG TPA: molybdenum cofactor biosynthesis protein MoaE [Terriglobales bacterium]|nr:molybdenum cofactor biosynthesis protein MoaE [Terriglobales bacterium]
MQVRVKFFGMLKEVAGRDDDTLGLPEGARIVDLLERCAKAAPDLKPYFPVIAVALNHEYSEHDAALHEGDEVALIPPVSGGSSQESVVRSQHEDLTSPHARITWNKIDTDTALARIKRAEDGAAVVFEGVVRNHSRGRRTLYLDYEAYEAMAIKELENLATQALGEFAIRDVAIVHRLGRLEIGETSVLIVVASAHREAAFDACRAIIDTLKRTVPIWKKEYFEDGAVWADGEPFPPEISRAAADPGGPPAASK